MFLRPGGEEWGVCSYRCETKYNEEEDAVQSYSDAGLEESFAGIVRRYGEIKAAHDKVEALLEAQKQIIAEQLQAKGIKSCFVADHAGVPHWQPTWCEGKKGHRHIDPMKLMDLGVTSDVIQRATVTGEPGRPYLLVTDLTKPRKKAGEGE